MTRERFLEDERRLAAEVDRVVEQAIRFHWAPADTFRALWAPLLAALGGTRAAAELVDETGQPQRYESAAAEAWPAEALQLLATDSAAFRVCEGRGFVAYPLEVAGARLGALLVELAAAPDAASGDARAELLAGAVEVLDNHLADLVAERRKQQAAHELSVALQSTILDEALRTALTTLERYVAVGDLLLVFRQEAGLRSAPTTYRVVRHRHDRAPDDAAVDARAGELLDAEDPELLAALGFGSAEQFVVVGPSRDRLVVAKLFVESARGRFDSFERDLLRLFVDFLRQRLVDFQREWRQLSRSFSPAHAARLLREGEGRTRFLSPQERNVAVLYADLSGFTRICETVLGKPALIAQLVDAFGEGAVAIVWEEGGVFDKMVGDCVIALFGPPFYEDPAEAACARALRAAERIRDMARDLERRARLPVLAGTETGVATGLNYCPMFVGYFGPDEAFTGFSSGMNATARLQGVATRDQILCSTTFVDALGGGARFGDEENVRVKNVAEPLRFRRLLG